MLLINICVLVGAILTPPSLRWLYSTHIALICLYQLRVKNWQCLILIAISLVFLTVNQVWKPASSLSESEIEVAWLKENSCFINLKESAIAKVLVRSTSTSQYAEACAEGTSASKATPVKLIVADLQGNRLQRYAYAKGADAMVYLASAKFSKKETPLINYFSRFASWRYAYSLVKGDRSLWDERDRWMVNYMGIGHLFVVSGLHVGFVCALMFWLARGVWRFGFPKPWKAFCNRQQIEFALAGPSCVAYALWVGAGDPVIRAAMIAVVLLALRVGFHSIGMKRAVLMCAWLMLLAWPGRLLDPSFWLSFSFIVLLMLLLQQTPSRGRFLYLQATLTGFALLLTAGWQSSVSVLVLLVNLLLIPFVALVWFPATLLSLLEYSVLQQSYVYAVLDVLLVNIYAWLEPFLYLAPSLPLQSSIPTLIKLFSIALAFLGVFFLPLRRGWLLIIVVVGSLFTDLKMGSHKLVWYRMNDVVLESEEGHKAIPIYSMDHSYFENVRLVVNPDKQHMAQRAIAENWQVALINSGAKEVELLQALSVQTVLIDKDERFTLDNIGNKWQVKSSNCYRILNLMKTVACEHAETLESVLN